MTDTIEIKRVPVMTIRFSGSLTQEEVPLFRGAVISKVPPELTLFHNHVDDGFRYHYPLIQYKRIQRQAAIVCIGEGTEEIGSFFAQADFQLWIGRRTEHFEVVSVKAERFLLQPWTSMFTYRLRKWLPFNQHNYEQYQQIEGLANQIEFLQRILVGNVLSMCTGLGIHVERQIECQILALDSVRPYVYKGVRMIGFDLSFNSNFFIPDYLGLGKGVSLGFGMIKPKTVIRPAKLL